MSKRPPVYVAYLCHVCGEGYRAQRNAETCCAVEEIEAWDCGRECEIVHQHEDLPRNCGAPEKGTVPWHPQHESCKRCGSEPPSQGWPGYPLGTGAVPICLQCWFDITGRAYRQATS